MNGTKPLPSFQHDQTDMFAPIDQSSYQSISSDRLSLPSSPFRNSFANCCLVSVVSKMGIEIEVEYYEKEDEIMTKVESLVIIAMDVPLREVFMSSASLCEKFKNLSSKSQMIHCYAGDIEGEEISLEQCPKDVDYVLDALRNNNRPILILCREPKDEERVCKDSVCEGAGEESKQGEEEEEEEIGYVGYVGRTASGMIKDMFTPHSSSFSSSSKPVPPSPSSTSISSASNDSVLASPERNSSYGENAQHSPSNWRIPREIYECQDELVSAGEVISSEEEEEGEEEGSDEGSSVSSSSQNSLCRNSVTSNSSISSIGGTSDDSLSSKSEALSRSLGSRSSMFISSPSNSKKTSRKTLFGSRNSKESKSAHEIFLQNYNPKSKAQKVSDPGYYTLGRPHKKSKPKGRRISLKPSKSRSVDAMISSPSIGDPTLSGDKPLIRQSAIRSKRGTRIGPNFSQTIPETSYSFEISKVKVVFKSTELEVSCREYNTVRDLKDSIARHLNKLDPDRCTPWRGVDFIITYESEGKTYELYNDWQFIYMTALYKLWGEEDTVGLPVRAHLHTRGISDDIKVAYRISQLIGVAMDDRIGQLPGANTNKLRRVAKEDLKEAQWTRRVLHNFVKEVASERDAESYCLSMELASSSTSTILALKIPIDSKIKIIFHYKQYFSLVQHVKVQQTADGILREIFPCLVACGLVEDRIENYTLQICGERSYIAGNHELIAFRDIRRCIIKGEPVKLSVKEKPNPAEDKLCASNWRAIDPLSGSPPLHTDISRAVHRDSEIQALSSWDRSDSFTLKVEKVEQLPSLSTNRNSYSVIIEATLYHGEKALCLPITTTTKILDNTVTWKENIDFKIAKKNIPRAAKILFLVSEALQKKESVGVKKAPKFLYWGLTMVFDHQGMMYNGEHSMKLWKGRREKDEKKDSGSDNTYMPNPSGPASNNNDPGAVTLNITFDSYGFPIHFPSCAPQSWSMLLMQPNIANVAVRRQFQRLLEFIREGKLHSAVPAYIEKVNWGSLAESLEVYSLLDQLSEAWQEFPVEIALKLLDCDFPDESVRGFATRVLEEIPDERLEDFLLQLTQALKFEPHHDSLLARFLLKRALCNKRIGHFFFWYLKCEMVNPQYTTRFGVILEAYLTSCGEAMLRQFEHQVEMQTTLEEIGLELKQRCNDDQNKMQALLPEVLERYRVPQFEITPVYNPRIRLGNLRPNKCKIMASKKKPQWLEMTNVDDTVLKQTPTRLILKMGDDLRQDMITLRMFSLFEKLWEEDGLDLALIPYGCIATGPDTGFIEVVRNARTIAEVSGVNNQTKLLEWIKSHQKNEFGEVDGDNVKAAVKTFVHSCAGYSVATYVLGIGDRHNDNIMITTSGNLFHIDFGHFLGNIKYCMGFKREWAPFVLTPDFVYAMGGEDSSSFDTYKNLCCRAFLTLRRHADLIINLFSMMRSTGIPELTCVEDTDYIKNALVLEKNETEAEQMFRKVIKKCLDLKWTVQVMWKFHLLCKRGSS